MGCFKFMNFLKILPLQTASGHKYTLKKEKQETGHEQQPHRKSWSNHDILGQNLGLQAANSHGIPNKEFNHFYEFCFALLAI